VTAVVWKLGTNSKLEPVLVKLGITDHTTTEVAQVIKGSLNVGDALVTGSASATQQAGSATAAPLGGARGATGGVRVR
jgi:hypothetical protein